MFWLVPSLHVLAIFVALQGFFLDRLFLAVIVAVPKVLAPYLHVSATGVAAAINVSGGAALLFAIGSLAQAKGLGVLQPIILAVLAALSVPWLCFPKMDKRKVEAEVSLPKLEEPRKQ
jgi:fucose permease